MKKYVEFLMLTVETGQEYTVIRPDDTTVKDLVEHLMPLMKKSVVSNISVMEFPQESDMDECIDLVFNNTDPCEDITEAKSQEIISALKDDGFIVPEMLTPTLFVEIYKALEPDNDERS